MAETGKILEMLSELVHFSRTKISNAIGISGPLHSFLSTSSGMLACISIGLAESHQGSSLFHADIYHQ